MRWVYHLIGHHFRLKQLLEFRFQMATVLSVSRQQHTLVGKLFLKSLYFVTLNLEGHFIYLDSQKLQFGMQDGADLGCR